MKKKVVDVEVEIENDDGLTSVHFSLENNEYFSIARLDEEDEIYFEFNDQAFGGYTKESKYILEKESLILTFPENFAKIINCEETIEIDFKFDDDEFDIITQALEIIFSIDFQ